MELTEKKPSEEDVTIGAEEYKRSCSQLNITTEVKVSASPECICSVREQGLGVGSSSNIQGIHFVFSLSVLPNFIILRLLTL